jgi:hypothetical protein
MLFPRLIELIQTHAQALTQEAVQDLLTNPRTPSFRGVPRDELEERIFTLYHDLGEWIGDRNDDRVRAEYEDWGRRRYDQGIRLSEIIFAIVVLKRHLRRYVKDHGLIDVKAESNVSQELLPLQLHGAGAQLHGRRVLRQGRVPPGARLRGPSRARAANRSPRKLVPGWFRLPRSPATSPRTVRHASIPCRPDAAHDMEPEAPGLLLGHAELASDSSSQDSILEFHRLSAGVAHRWREFPPGHGLLRRRKMRTKQIAVGWVNPLGLDRPESAVVVGRSAKASSQ